MTEMSPRIARLLRELNDRGPRVIDEFWEEVAAAGTPLVEAVSDDSALVTFVWRGDDAKTTTGWGVEVDLTRIDGTDLWYGSQRLPTDLRTLYYIRHSGDAFPTGLTGKGPAHVDVLNRRPFCFPADRTDPNDRTVWVSSLTLPAAPAEPWSSPLPGAARGRMLKTSLRTAALGGRRGIGVYRPAAPAGTALPLLVVFDGYLSHKVLRIPTTLDNLIAARRIPPMLALFVTAPSGERRSRELRPGPGIRGFVTRELLPWARRRWRLADDPGHNIIAGSSLGGLAATYVAMVAPEMFGGVIAQSGSFWWPAPSAEPEWLTRAYANRPRLPLRFYLDVGNRETDSSRGEGLDQLSVNRRFRDVLVDRGYPVTYAEYVGAHDYVNWRRTFADGLLALLGSPVTPTQLGAAGEPRR